jgi:hypothetical protein
MNVLGICVLVLGTETWGEAVFNFHTLPDIFRNNGGVNVTNTLNYTCLCGNSTMLKPYKEHFVQFYINGYYGGIIMKTKTILYVSRSNLNSLGWLFLLNTKTTIQAMHNFKRFNNHTKYVK